MRRPELDHLLSGIISCHPTCTDLNLSAGRPLQVAVHGQLQPVSTRPAIVKLTPYQTETLALHLIDDDPRLLQDLVHHGACDTGYQLTPEMRLRANIFSQRGQYSIVLRRVETKVPSIAQLCLPAAFAQMAQEHNGLILLVGATGSGKSTTLAALIDEINRTRPVHIVTLEDPIEYVHQSQRATINQRELGTDFSSFAQGLRAAMRQAPKVILIGEIRDKETLQMALDAAETGHLVLSTFHSIDAGQAVHRMLGMVEPEEERAVRVRLAETVRWIIGKRLLPDTAGGRAAVHDILCNNLRIHEVILLGESEGKTYYEIQEQGQATYHMMTYDQSILEAFQAGTITEETALSYATRKAVVLRGVDHIKQKRGLPTAPQEEITLDHQYNRGLKLRR